MQNDGVLPTPFWAVVAGVFGLVIGSFLNVVIYRVPENLSVVNPPSRCPNCGSTIHNRHNVPVVGWLVLRGRCFSCKEPISPRYPVVEAVTAALFVVVTVRLLDLKLGEALPAYLYFAAIGVALTMIDIDHKRLPNAIVLPSYAVLGVALLGATVADGDWWALARAGIGAAVLFAFYFAIAFAYPLGMGLGDVKLAGLIGAVLAYLSWRALAVGAFGGFVLGSVGGVLLIALGRGGRKSQIPFGPYMIAAALLALFLANPLADAYLDLVGR
ncbi:MAG: leader peptidase (prepilin peptidase) / N-methyltransferase [Pseudonocardiales bacterium]|jgi:leader peptidase (prepilin peptidase)/N-methyltransferase|nr:leader peptidase (prepilin peptidase) / N-methyltransferase [Pseudonocardiales bacterium]